MTMWTKEQLLAINSDGQNIIVSAGAGSGKTAVLSERVVEKLKHNIKINELLILTFTNAAASEMKERIRKKISENNDILFNLDYLESSYITTFDSYTLSLVKKYNYLLNVSDDLSIADDALMNLQKQKILDQVFMEMYESDNPLFQKFIKDFEIKDDSKIKRSILQIIKNIDLKVNRDEYLDNYINDSFNEDIINKYINEYEQLIKKLIDNIETEMYYISSSEYNDYYLELESALTNLIHASTYDEMVKYAFVKLPRRPRGSDDIKEYKDRIDSYLKDIYNYLRFKDKSEIIESIKLTKDYNIIIIMIIKRYYQYLDNYKYNNDLYEFNDIAKLAINLLKSHEEIRLELKNYYNEILVDEYQDTNDIQEEFINLISNNNVYMVGDIKQSIYGFRNANPLIFKEKYDNYSLNKGGMKIDLLKNFRSRSETLEGINKIFSYIMDDYLGGCDYVKEHQMNYGNLMYENKNDKQNYNLEIYNYEKNDLFNNEEIESFIIGRDILKRINNKEQVIDKNTKELRDVTYSDFCIIMDRGTTFKTYKKVFEYLHIPLNIYMDRILTNEIDILVINNLITLILKINEKKYDEEFKYAFVSVARSFLFQYNDSSIFEIIKNKDYQKTSIYELCLKISLDINKLNCYEILLKIIDVFNYYENIMKIGNVDDSLIRLDNLLNMADNLGNLGYNLNDFSEYLKEMINSDSEIKYKVNSNIGNAVKIMNIHKSKGLEFPICYFSGLYKTFNIDDIKKEFTYHNKYGIITPYYKEGIGYTILSSLFKNEYILNNISENIRLFYVALTRAKEKIILVSPLLDNQKNVNNLVDNNIREKYNSHLSIINSIKNNLQEYIKTINLDDYHITKEYMYNKNNNLEEEYKLKDKIDFKTINIPNDLVEEEHASKTVQKLLSIDEINSMEYGTHVHEIFEQTDFLNIKDDNPYKEELTKLVETLNITKDTLIYKEHEFIYEDNNITYHGIIDLVLINKDNIIIVDYKLKNIDDEHYKEQLKVYYNYLKSMFNKKIYTYLYSILNKELKEITD